MKIGKWRLLNMCGSRPLNAELSVFKDGDEDFQFTFGWAWGGSVPTGSDIKSFGWFWWSKNA